MGQTDAWIALFQNVPLGWLGSRVVSVLDSGTDSGKLFTPIVPLFTKQQNW